MLATVQGVDDKSRSERETLTPWLKFLWEAYRSVLDILRNNNKLEQLYHVTFSFSYPDTRDAVLMQL